MKIIYIANSRIPTTKAHGFQIIKMCEAFSNTGLQVELWAPKRFNPIKEDPFRYYNIRETFTIKKIAVIDLIPLSRYLGFVANFIESLSFALFSIVALSRRDFDIVYSRDQFILWFLSFFKKRFVYEIHNFPNNPKLYKKIWAKAFKIITITQALKNLIVNEGISAEKILVAPDGVDLAAFDAVNLNKVDLRIELALPRDNFLVSYIGKFKALDMEKGIATMIEALPLLGGDIKMVFVGGEENDLKEYKVLANRFNILNQCVFISHQPYTKVIRYMKAMDALVIPSPNKPHFAFYSSPLKLFEYMASGRPIIASSLPALREILNDKNALFFKPDSASELAQAVKMLKSSHTLGYHLSQQALADVREYTWDNRARRILDFMR